MPATNGRTITLPEIQENMTKYSSVIRKAKPKLLTGPATDPELEGYYNNEFNGFVFDRSLVERFFDGSMGQRATRLVVLMGAHPKASGTFKENEPTVVLVGCVVDPEKENDLVSLNDGEPGTEHPPAKIFYNPPFNGSGPASFTIS